MEDTAGILTSTSWWKRKTSSEKLILLSSGIIILVTLILSVALILILLRFPETVCMTPGCVKHAAYVLERMNLEADPCEDFYDFVCGNFLKSTIIPVDKEIVNDLQLLGDEESVQLRALLEAPIKSTDTSAVAKAKKFYKLCVNEQLLEKQGIQPLKKFINEYGGWPVVEGDKWREENFNWIDLIFKFRNAGFPFNYFVNLVIVPDFKNPNEFILELHQANLDLNRQHLVGDKSTDILKAFYNYMVDTAVLFGANRQTAQKECQEVLDFHKKLAQITLPFSKLSNKTALYNLVTVEELQKKYPYINWMTFINKILPSSIQVSHDELINNAVPSYYENLDNLLKTTPKRTIANYLITLVVKHSMGGLPESYRGSFNKFIAAFTGIQVMPPKWKRCISATSISWNTPVAQMYIKNHFNATVRDDVAEIVRYIRAEFRLILEKVDWMDEKTKKYALKKADAMDVHVGFPDELLDDNIVDKFHEKHSVDETSYLLSFMKDSLFYTNYAFSQLRKPLNKTFWFYTANALPVNAYYNNNFNSITIPAGILRGRYYAQDRPNFMNFGAIGFTIGHEITHGFDNIGRQFNAEGKIEDWWDPITIKDYLKKTQCIIEQYDDYFIRKVKLSINGLLTQGENIADNGGIKEAYYAYKKWLKSRANKPEPQLPGLPFNSFQMFWISTGTAWCAKERPEYLKQTVLTASHAPHPFRIFGSFSNRPEFAEDFNCPLGSRMNPKKKCEVW